VFSDAEADVIMTANCGVIEEFTSKAAVPITSLLTAGLAVYM